MCENTQMELIVSDRSYSDSSENSEALLTELHERAASIDDSATVRSIDIGRGADWPAFLVAFTSIGGLFLLGKKIEENLAAWCRLATQFAAASAQSDSTSTAPFCLPSIGL